MSCSRTHQSDARGALTRGTSVLSQALYSELQKTQVLKDVTIVDVKSTESDVHFSSLVTLQVLV